MGDTNISGLGKILSGNEVSVSGGHLKESDVKVVFSEVMAQSNLKSFHSQNLYNNAETPVHRREEPSLDKPPAADYEKFQYKDNKIPEKTEYNTVADNDVVEEKMTAFSEQVKEVLKEELGVSEEEISKAMETLGLSYADLLNQNNLASLVAELTGDVDVCGLLCSEQFLNVMQGVNTLSQELLQELGMSMEEFVSFINAQRTAEEVVVEDTVITTNESTPAENMSAAEENVDVSADVEKTVEEAVKQTSTEGVTEESVQAENAVKEAASKTASEETAAENGKISFEDATTAETTVSDETPVATMKTEEQQEEDASGEMQQNAEKQTAVVEEWTEENTQKPTFRQVVKETNEQAAEGMQMNHTANANQVSGPEVMQNIPQGMNMREIMNQLVDAARVTVSMDTTKMEMQLNPENLGKMYLEIVEKDGIISARIQLQNEAVKEAVEAQIVELRQNLNQAGVKVDAVEVTVASHEFERNLEQDAKRDEQQASEQEKTAKHRRINLNELDELSGLMSEEETLVAKMMAEQGNSIDFTA